MAARKLTAASRHRREPLARATSSAKSLRGRERKYPSWWRGHLPTRDGAQRFGTRPCRCHRARQNHPPRRSGCANNIAHLGPPRQGAGSQGGQSEVCFGQCFVPVGAGAIRRDGAKWNIARARRLPGASRGQSTVITRLMLPVGTLPRRGVLVTVGADAGVGTTRPGMTIQSAGGAAWPWRCGSWRRRPASAESMPRAPAWDWPDAGHNPPQRIQRVRY